MARRDNITKETPVTEESFTHKCFGVGVHMTETPFEFKFKCVPMPDGRKGCKCPNCQTTFVFQSPS